MTESFEQKLIKIKPEDVVDELYGAPKTENQRKLESFLNKREPGTFVDAEDSEGKRIIFELKEIQKHWAEFYKNGRMVEISNELKRGKLQLSEDQILLIKEKCKEGFNNMILMPSVPLQKKYFNQIQTEANSHLAELPEEEQYIENDYFDMDLPEGQNYHTNHRPHDKPYIILLKDKSEVDDDTLGKDAPTLEDIFEKKNETGFTLVEYFIFQRDYVQRHRNEKNIHPDKENVTWLLDSTISNYDTTDIMEREQALIAGWSCISHWTKKNFVRIYSKSNHMYLDKKLGARSAVILKFE